MSWDSYRLTSSIEPAKKKVYWVYRQGRDGRMAVYNYGMPCDSLDKAKRYALKESPELNWTDCYVICREVGRLVNTRAFPSGEALDMALSEKGYFRHRDVVLAPVGEVWSGRYHSYKSQPGLKRSNYYA